MKLKIIITLFLTLMCYTSADGDIFTSHLKPTSDSTLDIGSAVLLWRYIYGDSFTDGTALWDDNSLSGFTSIEGTTLTDGTFIVTGGIITAGTWQGTDIDISDYTNLIGGTNITLSDDTLDVDDAFLVNDASDTTTGTLTAAGFTTTGTATTDVLIVGSNPPSMVSSSGTAGTITYDSNYIYVCIATDTWKRAALSTWAITDVLLLDDGSSKLLLDDGR